MPFPFVNAGESVSRGRGSANNFVILVLGGGGGGDAGGVVTIRLLR